MKYFDIMLQPPQKEITTNQEVVTSVFKPVVTTACPPLLQHPRRRGVSKETFPRLFRSENYTQAGDMGAADTPFSNPCSSSSKYGLFNSASGVW